MIVDNFSITTQRKLVSASNLNKKQPLAVLWNTYCKCKEKVRNCHEGKLENYLGKLCSANSQTGCTFLSHYVDTIPVPEINVLPLTVRCCRTWQLGFECTKATFLQSGRVYGILARSLYPSGGYGDTKRRWMWTVGEASSLYTPEHMYICRVWTAATM